MFATQITTGMTDNSPITNMSKTERPEPLKALDIKVQNQNCQYRPNETHVFDPFGLLSDCEKVEIDYEIEKLERQTRINQSEAECDHRGINTTVIIAKNQSANFLAQKVYQALYRQMNPTCLKTFILAYTSNPDDQPNEFGYAYGRDSPISGHEIRTIFEKEIENLDADQMIHAISNIISKVRITSMQNINVSLSEARKIKDQHCQYQRNQSNVVDNYGLFSDCEKVKLDYELDELEQQTRTNLSTYACDQRGLSGTVVIAKNESATLFANKIYQDQYLVDMYNRLCQNFFVFVYSADGEEFNWRVGLNSPITTNEIKDIVREQIKNFDTNSLGHKFGYGLIHAISSMISDIRIGAIENMKKKTPADQCQYQQNGSHVIDPYGLLNSCQRGQVNDELIELQLQTITNHSGDNCDYGGFAGIVIIVKDENATYEALEFYKYVYRNSSKLDYRINCRNSLILAYSYETGQLGFTKGTDSPLNLNEIKRLFQQAEKKYATTDRWIDMICGLISDIRTAAIAKLSTKEPVEKWVGWFRYFYQIALKIGLLGNVLCIVAILFTKLIKSAVNKYLVVLLTSDTLFILWVLSGEQTKKMQSWNVWSCTFVNYMLSSTVSASSNILVLLTMERFFAIIFPLHHMQYSHINRWLVMLLALLPMQFYTLYFYLRPHFETEFISDNEVHIMFENGKCYQEGMFNIQTNNIPFHVSLFILPLFTIIFVNVAIAIRLRQKRNSKVKSTKPKDGSNETLWILPTIYATLSTPVFIMMLVKKFFYPKSLSYVVDGIDIVLLNMFLLDYVFNWFFYALASSAFRRTFILFWTKLYRKIRPVPKISGNKRPKNSTATKRSKDTRHEEPDL